MCYNIMAVRLGSRRENALKVQEELTKHGCIIKARLGLHDAGDQCSEEGLLLLQLCGDEAELEELRKAVESLDGVTAKLVTL